MSPTDRPTMADQLMLDAITETVEYIVELDLADVDSDRRRIVAGHLSGAVFVAVSNRLSGEETR